MKTRAAVAWEAGKPLTVETIDIEGPRDGEVLVEVMATGVCHTDAYTLSGADPEGLFPADPRPRGRRHRARDRPGRGHAQAGRPRHPALHARVPAVQNLPVAPLQPLHRHPRDAGQGRDAGRHQPLPVRGDEPGGIEHAVPLHGLLDLRELHGAARDRAGEGARGRALRQDLLHRLRRHHRHRRRDLHGQGVAGRQRRGVRPRRHRPQRDPGRADGRRRQDRRRGPQPRRSAPWPSASA